MPCRTPGRGRDLQVHPRVEGVGKVCLLHPPALVPTRSKRTHINTDQFRRHISRRAEKKGLEKEKSLFLSSHPKTLVACLFLSKKKCKPKNPLFLYFPLPENNCSLLRLSEQEETK